MAMTKAHSLRHLGVCEYLHRLCKDILLTQKHIK